MAEIGLIASIVGIVGAGTKLSIAIFDFATTVGSAGKELQNVGTEISLLCSVFKQLQALLEHAHFHPSMAATESALRIISECQKVFTEIDEIIKGLMGARGDELFPSPDFASRLKWTFSKRSKVLVLRSTVESCKLTLSVMLNTMQLAERVSQRRQSTVATLQEDEQDKTMTQSLLISQQCAVEQLEHYEEEAEKEDEVAMQLPGISAPIRTNTQTRRKSRTRLVRMFSGLSIVTNLPDAPKPVQHPPTRTDRASLWLDSILAPEDRPTDPHPGVQRRKRLSSVGTANAPLQLLRKWTDQTTVVNHEAPTRAHTQETEASELWRDSKFSFKPSRSTSTASRTPPTAEKEPATAIQRAPTDLVSPKTARVQSIGFHVVVGVDGSLESSDEVAVAQRDDASYESITQSILHEHGAAGNTSDVTLCISYSGKTKVLKPTDKPLEVLKQYADLELDPRLFVRRNRSQPP